MILLVDYEDRLGILFGDDGYRVYIYITYPRMRFLFDESFTLMTNP